MKGGGIGTLGAAAVTAVVAALAASAAPAPSPTDDSQAPPLRVCSDPNNMPFSSRDQAGFENKIASIVASDLGRPLTYIWRPQRRAYIRNTLKAGLCDAVMGVPAKLSMVTVTHPYYRSTYVFVYRSDRGYGDLRSIRDPRLKHLSIGVQLIGDDGYNTPPAHALSEQGMVTNLVGYTVYGDYREPNPPARIVEAVENGTVDIAAVWGPLAGYFGRDRAVPLTIEAITDTADFEPLQFQYEIAIGVGKGNDQLAADIDGALGRHRSEITQLLQSYGVPLVAPKDAESKQPKQADP